MKTMQEARENLRSADKAPGKAVDAMGDLVEALENMDMPQEAQRMWVLNEELLAISRKLHRAVNEDQS